MPRALSLALLLFVNIRFLQTCLAASVSIHDASWEPQYALYATEEDIEIDCARRSSVVFNGTAPGPPLYLREGESTWIRVHNRLSGLNMTMHWHGLTMRTAPFSDGSPQVAQWPIAPGEYFDYEIRPEIGDAGTYFYHSHIGFQAMTAHGLLIVQDAGTPPYHWDDDVLILLSDFYQKSDAQIQNELLSTPFIWPGEPDALSLNHQTGTASFEDDVDESCKPFIITVEPGKTYRFRFVGATTISFLQVGIEGHTDLTVISADGYYTKPAKIDHVQIAGGQRFDALITAKTEEQLLVEGRDQYWVRFETRGRSPSRAGYALLQYAFPDTVTDIKRDIGSRSPHGRGEHGRGRHGRGQHGRVQHVKGQQHGRAQHEKGHSNGQKGGKGHSKPKPPAKNPKQPPVSLPPDGTLTDWLEYTLEALDPKTPFPPLSEVSRTIYITLEEKIIDGAYAGGSVTGSLVWENNGLSWTENEAAGLHYKPYIIDAYLTGNTPDYDAALQNQGWDPKTRAFPAKVGEVLDIVWLSNSGPTGVFEYHPMHAHGEHYWDLGSGNGTYDPVSNEEKFKNYTPARRDTTMLFRYTEKGKDKVTAGWRAWRIRITDENVGAWMMHCHILHHMVMGMQTAWVFGDAAAILRQIPAPYITGYLDYGGSAYGNDTYDPLVLSYFE